jgi:hypothetical protein
LAGCQTLQRGARKTAKHEETVDLRGAERIVPVNHSLTNGWETKPLKWSPDGQTLAFIDGATLRTVEPDRSLELPLSTNMKHPDEGWDDFRWSPNGQQIIAYGADESVVVDVRKRQIIQRIPRDTLVWWFGNELATSKTIDRGEVPENNVQTWKADGATHQFPTGLKFENASQNGRAILASDLSTMFLWLLMIDPHSGKVYDKRQIRSFGRVDLEGGQRIDWNPYRRLAVHGLKAKAADKYCTFVSSKDWESELTLGDGKDLNWSGRPSWIDDRRLCVCLEENHQPQPSVKQIAIYDSETGYLHPVYASSKMIETAATQKWVAILEKDKGKERIVISGWNRSPDGTVIGTVYRSPDAGVVSGKVELAEGQGKLLKKNR